MKKIFVFSTCLGLIFLFWILSSEIHGSFNVFQKTNTSSEEQKSHENIEIESHLSGASVRGVAIENGKFFDTLDSNKSIFESGEMETSRDENWWLNSGGVFYSEDGVGKTNQKKLPENDFWRELYNKNNPRDTDNGYHPQNIFRLVTRNKWDNLRQEGYFRIVADNLSASQYRNASNGLLFFNRYQDGDNLYYTGIRVDGFAVIKKKIKGKYFTMAYERIFPGKYDRKKNPNLLPHNAWIGLRSEVTNENEKTVLIKIFIDRERKGNWELVAEARDDGKKYGGKAIMKAGYGGIRTDFMDVEFDDYKIEEL